MQATHFPRNRYLVSAAKRKVEKERENVVFIAVSNPKKKHFWKKSFFFFTKRPERVRSISHCIQLTRALRRIIIASFSLRLRVSHIHVPGILFAIAMQLTSRMLHNGISREIVFFHLHVNSTQVPERKENKNVRA